MKNPLLLPLVLGLLLTGCTSLPNEKHFPPSAITSPAAGLLILSATYGSGVNFADVSLRVNDLIHQPGVEFSARPQSLLADPTPGWNKALVIIYEYKGRRHLFASDEGGAVSAEILIQNADK